jgi:hypothetical protein
VGLLSLLPLTLLKTTSGGSTAATSALIATSGSRIAYFGFDRTADTLWLADPQNPSSRTKGLTIAHAPDYGAIPTRSPDGRSFAYLVLPGDTPAPGPASPAELWVASIAGGSPRLIASGADLLVHAVWAPGGQGLVYRRSDEASHLMLARLGGGEPIELASSANALFPVAYEGANLLYVELSDAGSVLRSTAGFSARLSDGLTRDWALSPDGSRIAYLEMMLATNQAASRAFVFDMASGTRTAVGAPDADAFSPAWGADGSLAVGQLKAGETTAVTLAVPGSTKFAFTAPQRGFDVPLALDATAGLAVTSFDGNTITNPGRASLVVVRPDGSRREIASGEVTFLGWISP